MARPQSHSRRDLLRLAGTASAGAVAASLMKAAPIAASNGDTLAAGGTFTETTPLRLSNASGDGSAGALVVQTAGAGAAVTAITESGTSLLGWVGPSAPNDIGNTPPRGATFQVNLATEAVGVEAMVSVGKGVWGMAGGTGAVGVFGQTFGSEGGIGVAGIINDSIPDDVIDVGVYGQGPAGGGAVGVLGRNASGGTGVAGIGAWGVYALGDVGLVGDALPGATAIYGHLGTGAPTTPPPNVAIYAEAPSSAHTALRVQGKAVFSRSGRLTITSGHSSVAKTLPGVTSSSLVIATLQTYRSGVYVAAAIPSSGKLTIRLNKTVSASTVVAWFVLN